MKRLNTTLGRRFDFTTQISLSFVSGLVLANSAFAGMQIPPILMEEATVQGKIIILENFQEDRQAAVGLRIEIWSAKEVVAPPSKNRRMAKMQAAAAASGNEELNFEKNELVLETETDEDGFFYIEEGFELRPGNYIIAMGDVRLILIVEPLSGDRAGLNPIEKQKTLLILVPKEIFN